ncbi:MAG: ribonuclease H-like domain-containing protein [Patescibacteria group bacterium]
MDKIVLDIETKNSFFEVGQDNTAALEPSFVGLYSYNQDAYLSFFENDFDKLGEVLKRTRLVVGFCLRRFDLPVLKRFFSFDVTAIPSVDIFEDIQKAVGFRIGLGALAYANLGVGKTGHGLEAIDLYKSGRLEQLKNYCLNDVKITKELYEMAQKQGYLWVPRRDHPEMIKLALSYPKEEFVQAQLL